MDYELAFAIMGLSLIINWLDTGILFTRNNHFLVWIWPWKRHNGRKYLDIVCEAYFKTLKEHKEYHIDLEKALVNIKESNIEL